MSGASSSDVDERRSRLAALAAKHSVQFPDTPASEIDLLIALDKLERFDAAADHGEDG